jgi:hypothetical protein
MWLLPCQLLKYETSLTIHVTFIFMTAMRVYKEDYNKRYNTLNIFLLSIIDDIVLNDCNMATFHLLILDIALEFLKNCIGSNPF